MLCAEDVVKAYDRCHPSNVIGEQPHSMIVDLIAPLEAELIQDMKETEETPVIREIKRDISEDLSRRYTTVQETRSSSQMFFSGPAL